MSDEPEGATARPFEPARYLTRVGGSDYLEVKWRLVWMRDKHPDATIDTELVSHADNTAVFRAAIVIPGGGSATGYGSESAGDFRDYLEKAETKAIGRALAALGFGTQFCPDFEFGAAHGRTVDAPVKTPTPRRVVNGQRTAQPGNGRAAPAAVAAAVAADGPEQPATKTQLDAVTKLAKKVGLAPPALEDRVKNAYGVAVEALNRRDAAALIAALQIQGAPAPASA